MSKIIRRGDIRLASARELDENDEEMAKLTVICIVGTNLRQNVDLVKDVKSFGHKIFFSR